MYLIYLVVAAIWFSKVIANDWPNGTTTNLLKSIAIDESDANSSDFRLHDIEFDSNTGDFFYLGHFVNDSTNFHFISSFSNTGVERWSKVYASHSVHNSLEYSLIHETLYYLTDTSPPILMRVNSPSGAHLNSYQLADSSIMNNYGDCSLSGDEVALFWILYISNVASVIRLNTTTSEIVSINTVENQDYQA